MEELQSFVNTDHSSTNIMEKSTAPAFLSSQYEKPDKKEAVKQHQSRFLRKN
jgi:hypothetical protein